MFSSSDPNGRALEIAKEYYGLQKNWIQPTPHTTQFIPKIISKIQKKTFVENEFIEGAKKILLARKVAFQKNSSKKLN